ncbi:hypothetical protein KJ925_02955 [Patescibacteria group bacterium]|nr:hypothetical protein [Patescibacteria group bacterium]
MRICGSCKLCCTLLKVPELEKTEGVPCPFLCDKGCGIYTSRPAACRNFRCAWLNGELSENMRPDKVGVIIEKLPTGKTVLADSAEQDTPIPKEIIDFYTSNGLAIAARGQRVYLPKNMTRKDVYHDLRDAVSFLK